MPQCVLEKGEMRYFPKEKAALAVVVSSLILFALMFLMATKTITNVSGMVTEGVWVFEDSNCARECESIEWGTLTPGSVKEYDVYVRNKGEVPIYLIMSTTNWSSLQASYYLTLRWTYTGQKIDLGDVLQITLTLSVSPRIKDVSSFSFNIVITGSDRLPGDVDGDGDVDGSDMRKVVLAMFTDPEDPRWNPNADVDYDGDVDGGDQRKCQNNMFESW